MKKGLVTIICLLVLSFSALPVAAQTRSRRNINRSYSERTAYNNRVYRDSGYRNSRSYEDSRYYDGYGYDSRSRWEKSRDKITTAIGAGAGAAVGGLVGGKKGAIIGAIAGGGGAALYTYKIRDKRRGY
jgi:hypothetical protein